MQLHRHQARLRNALHFALIASIKRARDEAPEGRAVIAALFQDATITKSRAKTAFRDALGVTQRFGSSPQETRFKSNARTRRNKVTPPTRDRVINFFQRDDVSRQLPGKRDYKVVSRGEAFQPRGDSVSSTTENYCILHSHQAAVQTLPSFPPASQKRLTHHPQAHPPREVDNDV